MFLLLNACGNVDSNNSILQSLAIVSDPELRPANLKLQPASNSSKLAGQTFVGAYKYQEVNLLESLQRICRLVGGSSPDLHPEPPQTNPPPNEIRIHFDLGCQVAQQ